MSPGTDEPLGLTIVTGWSPQGWYEYGMRFYETFARHWHPSIKLVVYGEKPPPIPIPRAQWRDLLAIPGCADFLDRHMQNRDAHGNVPRQGFRERERLNGYSFRFDAWKFCRQGFIPWDASLHCDTPLLCWLDGDVVTHADVPAGAIQALLPAHKDLAFLGRQGTHSEIAFQLYRVAACAKMLTEFKELYRSDAVFKLRQWHSAFVFDHARLETMDPNRWHNLTPEGFGHVWFQSPLKRWLDHLKGKRKEHGQSPERNR